jgi:phosphatidylserine decarboxylase
MGKNSSHQYVERETSRFKDEQFFGDQAVQFLYSRLREKSPVLFNALISPYLSSWLAYFIYDNSLGSRMTGTKKLFHDLKIDLSECLDDPGTLTTVRKLFERKIRYWETRPMSNLIRIIVSPSDSRILLGSFSESSEICLKDKFFNFEELLGHGEKSWQPYFTEGDFAVFRLTPEKYHFNHTPVAGKVLDIFEIEGDCHSCHPEAVVALATPFSKNKRLVTILDTDVEGGSQAGLVAMIEVVALLIGNVVQCYSEDRYDHPQPIVQGMFLKKGRPKSLYRPGSSTNVLIFQKGRVVFCGDLIANLKNQEVASLFSKGFGQPLAETEIKVRSPIAVAVDKSLIVKGSAYVR